MRKKHCTIFTFVGVVVNQGADSSSNELYRKNGALIDKI